MRGWVRMCRVVGGRREVCSGHSRCGREREGDEEWKGIRVGIKRGKGKAICHQAKELSAYSTGEQCSGADTVGTWAEGSLHGEYYAALWAGGRD